ncbi:MAG: hypothetical protein LBQ66_04195 [Planctomycetaceae bacterium]|nr:hypothetical protein [Planctomycetaceae bacterium]
MAKNSYRVYNPKSHVLSLKSRNEIATVYNLTIADYHTYPIGVGETRVGDKSMSVARESAKQNE